MQPKLGNGSSWQWRRTMQMPPTILAYFSIRVELFVIAANRGVAAAQNNLGLLYRAGKGAPKDSGKALFWFRKAAASKHPEAMNNLGVMLDNGEGVNPDKKAALALFESAARSGSDKGAINAAILLERGGDGTPNLIRAYAWANIAAGRGSAQAEKIKVRLADKLPRPDIDKAQRLSVDLLSKNLTSN
jgi:TPR repeat protein